MLRYTLKLNYIIYIYTYAKMIQNDDLDNVYIYIYILFTLDFWGIHGVKAASLKLQHATTYEDKKWLKGTCPCMSQIPSQVSCQRMPQSSGSSLRGRDLPATATKLFG